MTRRSQSSLRRRGHLHVVPAPKPDNPIGNVYRCAECGAFIPEKAPHVFSPQLGTRYCDAMCASKVSAPERLAATKAARFEEGKVPAVVRMSTVLRNLRRSGQEDVALALENLHKAAGSSCPQCGPLPDPVIGHVVRSDGEKQIAFACPACSSPQVREAWEREGRLGVQ